MLVLGHAYVLYSWVLVMISLSMALSLEQKIICAYSLICFIRFVQITWLDLNFFSSVQLQKTIDDQKARIRKTQRALEIAEVCYWWLHCFLPLSLEWMVFPYVWISVQEELMKAKFEATFKTKELMRVLHCSLQSVLIQIKYDALSNPSGIKK